MYSWSLKACYVGSFPPFLHAIKCVYKLLHVMSLELGTEMCRYELSVFPWCFQEVLPPSDSNRHLKDIDEEIFDDDDFYHQVGGGKCVLEFWLMLAFNTYRQNAVGSMLCISLTCETQLPVLAPKISASTSGDSALSFCCRVWSSLWM